MDHFGSWSIPRYIRAHQPLVRSLSGPGSGTAVPLQILLFPTHLAFPEPACLALTTVRRLVLGTAGTAKGVIITESAQGKLVCRLQSMKPSNSQKRRMNMNWDQAQGNWKQVKGKVKEKWGQLTDDELDQIEGKRDQLVGKIQKQYGISKEEAERQVKHWEDQSI